MSAARSFKVIYVALAANVAIAATKFIVGVGIASSAMISEAIHSTVDSGNELLLWVGLRRSARPPDAEHPFGYGRELYFWSLIVAILLFGLGGGMAVYEGIRHWLHPQPVQDPRWAYLVLALAAVFEAFSFRVTVREVLGGAGWRELRERLRRCKDPSVFTIFFEDLAALLGLAVAFCGVWLEHRYNDPRFDAAASIVVGILLAAVALLLVYKSRDLLIGKGAEPASVTGLRELVLNDPAIANCSIPLTMYLGPEELLVTLNVEFMPQLSADEQMQALRRVEAQIRAASPVVKRVYVEPSAFGSAGPSRMEPKSRTDQAVQPG